MRFRGLCLRDSNITVSPRAENINGSDIEMLVRSICLCHDVTRVKSEKGNFLTGSSQDELVLMEMIEKENIGSFMYRDSDFFKIEIRG